MGALTSTLWGIIFTIVFKLVDSGISFHLDMGERITELVQMREYEGTQKKAESRPETAQAASQAVKREEPAPVAENVPVTESAPKEEATAEAEPAETTETVTDAAASDADKEDPDTAADTEKAQAAEAQNGDEEA